MRTVLKEFNLFSECDDTDGREESGSYVDEDDYHRWNDPSDLRGNERMSDDGQHRDGSGEGSGFGLDNENSVNGICGAAEEDDRATADEDDDEPGNRPESYIARALMRCGEKEHQIIMRSQNHSLVDGPRRASTDATVPHDGEKKIATTTESGCLHAEDNMTRIEKKKASHNTNTSLNDDVFTTSATSPSSTIITARARWSGTSSPSSSLSSAIEDSTNTSPAESPFPAPLSVTLLAKFTDPYNERMKTTRVDTLVETATGAGSAAPSPTNSSPTNSQQWSDGSNSPTSFEESAVQDEETTSSDAVPSHPHEVSVPTVSDLNDDEEEMSRCDQKLGSLRCSSDPSNKIGLGRRDDDDCSSTESIYVVPRKYVAYALLLWLFELVMVLALKRVGFLAQEFRLEEVVKQSVLPHFEQGWSRLNESIPLMYLTQEKKRPGYNLAREGASVDYPVVIVPGFVTSGLQVWGGTECARKHFRQRLWAAFGGARSFLMERDCWRTHMMLDPYTGSDPDGIRLRAAEGFEAADYFMANYWVFGKLIENLADLGYTPSDMSMEPYDWRLAFPLLEERDGYLTRLKTRIEVMVKTHGGKKVVLTSHSMGAQLVHYFFAWVTTDVSRGGGGGGKEWVNDHIHTYVNIAGTHLGVPKAATALLSGEMSDTVFMGTMGDMVEQFFGRRLRRDLWMTWGSLWAMLPQGGDGLWGVGADICSNGSASTAPKDTASEAEDTAEIASDSARDSIETASDPFCPSYESGMLSPLLAMTATQKNGTASEEPNDSSVAKRGTAGGEVNAASSTEASSRFPFRDSHSRGTTTPRGLLQSALKDFLKRKSHTMEQTVDFLQTYGGNLGSDLANTKVYSQYGEEKLPSKSWHDPTRTPLPYAPDLKIFCLYGVGVPTERAYYYKYNPEESGTRSAAPEDARNSGDKVNVTDPPVVLDASVNRETQNVEYGVRYSDGDGSVPVLSLGYVCADAWQRKETGLNPSGTKVYTREYTHRQEFVVDDPMRGGPASADHVDILGNVDMTEDFLRIVSGYGVSKVSENRIASDIENIAAKINSHPLGGIKKRRRKKSSKFGPVPKMNILKSLHDIIPLSEQKA